MRPKRSGILLLALALAVGCGGDDGAATPSERSASFKTIGDDADALAEEAKRGCRNAPAIRRALGKLEADANDVPDDAVEVRRKVESIGAKTRDALRDCREARRLQREADELERKADEIDPDP